MRLYRYKAASRRLRLMVNRYPKGKLPIGLAVQWGVTVWSLVWGGPGALRHYRCCDHPKPSHHPRCPVVSRDPYPRDDPHFDTMHAGCSAEWSSPVGVAHFCAGDIDHDDAHHCRCGVSDIDGDRDG